MELVIKAMEKKTTTQKTVKILILRGKWDHHTMLLGL